MKQNWRLVAVLMVLALAVLACNAPARIPMTGLGGTPGPTRAVTPGTPGLLTGTPGIGVPNAGTPGAGVQPDGACTYKITFVSDVSVPDDTQMTPGQTFVKTWRVKNDGTCTWGPTGYALHALTFTGGDKMGAPDVVPLTQVVNPGDTVDVSVPLTAPATPGTYTGQWMFSVDNDPSGAGPTVGLQPGGKGALFVRIVVK